MFSSFNKCSESTKICWYKLGPVTYMVQCYYVYGLWLGRLFVGNYRKLKGEVTYCVVNSLQMNRSIYLKCIPFPRWVRIIANNWVLICLRVFYYCFTPHQGWLVLLSAQALAEMLWHHTNVSLSICLCHSLPHVRLSFLFFLNKLLLWRVKDLTFYCFPINQKPVSS